MCGAPSQSRLHNLPCELLESLYWWSKVFFHASRECGPFSLFTRTGARIAWVDGYICALIPLVRLDGDNGNSVGGGYCDC